MNYHSLIIDPVEPERGSFAFIRIVTGGKNTTAPPKCLNALRLKRESESEHLNRPVVRLHTINPLFVFLAISHQLLPLTTYYHTHASRYHSHHGGSRDLVSNGTKCSTTCRVWMWITRGTLRNVPGGNDQCSVCPPAYYTRYHWSGQCRHNLYLGRLLQDTQERKHAKAHPHSPRCQGALLHMRSCEMPPRPPSCTYQFLGAMSFRNSQ
ncbi:hypothetical protein F4604DRAFT_1708897 [Suillus subluteus]|nr:hypothetical protein F4604DRAFT_1708897 [Suillus subluteus]